MPNREEREEDLDLIDDLYRKCEICDMVYHEGFGHTCDDCDIWICNNCWPEHNESLMVHNK